MHKEITRRLMKARKDCGKSQAEVAADSGISIRTVSRIESEDKNRNRPRKEVVIRLALVTDHRPDEWLKMAGYPPCKALIEQIQGELQGSIPALQGRKGVLGGDILPFLKAILAKGKIKKLTFRQLQELILLKARQHEIEKKIQTITE